VLVTNTNVRIINNKPKFVYTSSWFEVNIVYLITAVLEKTKLRVQFIKGASK